MSFIKHFSFSLTEGLTLDNIEDRNAFLKEKIDHFSDYSNYSSKEELLSLFQEIADMYDYDLSTATFDFTGIDGTIGFPRDKIMMVAYYDITLMLGVIFLNVFDLPKNRISRIEDGISGAISTNQMFARAYNELVNCKATDGLPPAYGATLILATLFEKDLKEHTKRYYVNKYLTELATKVISGNIVLTANEAELFDYLLFNYELKEQRDSSVVFDSVVATNELQYNLLKKYLIIDPSNNTLMKLLTNKLTLTPFLRSNLFTNIADVRFVRIAALLFDSDNLNLRNNMAHCNFTYSNYYTLQITALLYGMFSMVSNEYYLA